MQEWLIKSLCSLCCFLSTISLFSDTLKQLSNTKLLRSLLIDFLSFVRFLLWWIFRFDYYHYFFYFGNIFYHIIFRIFNNCWMIVSLLWSSFFRNSIWSIKLLTLFWLFDKIFFLLAYIFDLILFQKLCYHFWMQIIDTDKSLSY